MSGRWAGVLLIAPALLLDPSAADGALGRSWPPFVLVAGLLAIGLVADRDGLFDLAAARLQALPGPPVVVLIACLALVALVSAVLNLDTAAVFCTPVLIRTARRRGLPADPFLYGAIFMANASSLFLPGSNLTNLLVLPGAGSSGGHFLVSMLPPALACSILTATGVLLLHRSSLRTGARRPGDGRPQRLHGIAGAGATLLAATLIVVLADPAVPVAALGALLLAWRAVRNSHPLRESVAQLGLATLAGLFGLAVALGTLARAGSVGAALLHGTGRVGTALIGALASVLVNNLPAAVVLSAPAHVHVRALLLGLDVGPNVALSGSLAVLLWWRAARASGERPSVLAYSRQGALLAGVALIASLALLSA